MRVLPSSLSNEFRSHRLKLCLDEIRACRPFFLGLLGERYDWVPDSIPGELLEPQAWLLQPPAIPPLN